MMNASTPTQDIALSTEAVTFVSGLEYGFAVDPRDANYIMFVGADSATTYKSIGAWTLNDAKGVFVAREVVSRLNTDRASELDLESAIREVRSIVG